MIRRISSAENTANTSNQKQSHANSGMSSLTKVGENQWRRSLHYSVRNVLLPLTLIKSFQCSIVNPVLQTVMGNALQDSSDEALKLSLPEWHKLLSTAMQFHELNQKCKNPPRKEM